MLQRIESEYEWALLSDTGARRARPLSTATVNEASDWDCHGGGEFELSSFFCWYFLFNTNWFSEVHFDGFQLCDVSRFDGICKKINKQLLKLKM